MRQFTLLALPHISETEKEEKNGPRSIGPKIIIGQKK